MLETAKEMLETACHIQKIGALGKDIFLNVGWVLRHRRALSEAQEGVI